MSLPKLIHVTTVPHTLHFLIGQISFMRQAGFDVQTVSRTDEKLDFFLQHESVVHHAVPLARTLNPWRDLVCCHQLWRIFRQEKPTIVHAHTPKAGLLAMLAATLAGVPVRVYHIHGLRFATLRGWRRQLVIHCEKWACWLASSVLCVSRSAKIEAVRAGLASPADLQVLGPGSISGLDAEQRFHPDRVSLTERRGVRERAGIPQDAIVVGFLGRLVRDKGIEELAAAWREVRARHRQAHLLLVGDFEEEDPVSLETRRELEADQRVHRLGYDPEAPRLFSAMDVFCLPSYREGLPYVALEAAAMELPVVSTRVTGCVDAVVDGDTGTLVDCGNVSQLTEALLRYTTDADLAQQHGKAGRRRILAEFPPERIWRFLLAEYDRLLADAGQARAVPPMRRAA